MAYRTRTLQSSDVTRSRGPFAQAAKSYTTASQFPVGVRTRTVCVSGATTTMQLTCRDD